ncbi:hypothetical protein MMC22_010764 [Lobaria immixta]|nr:hypothetical protein [Lobaria immixta]
MASISKTRAADNVLESSSAVIAKRISREKKLRIEYSLKRVRALSPVKLRSGAEGRDAIAGAVGLAHVVDGQDTPAGIVALPIDEVDGHATANLAVVRKQGVDQGPDLRQGEVGTLREQAETVIPLAEADAGDVLVVAVDCRGVFLRDKNGLVEILGDGYRFAMSDPAIKRAVAVDAKRGRDAKGSRDGEETGDGDGEIHVLRFLEGDYWTEIG